MSLLLVGSIRRIFKSCEVKEKEEDLWRINRRHGRCAREKRKEEKNGFAVCLIRFQQRKREKVGLMMENGEDNVTGKRVKE